MKKNIFKALFLCFALISVFFIASCDNNQTNQAKQQQFVDTVDEITVDEIALTYNEGDTLILELSDGTKVQWMITGEVEDFFEKKPSEGTIVCVGSPVEGGTFVKITARFVHPTDEDIVYDKTFEFMVNDNKIRNTEKGIPDPVLYKHMVVLADKNGDGKLTLQEGRDLIGDVVIENDYDFGEYINTTKGLHYFPNMSSLTIKKKVINFVVDGCTNLESLSYEHNSTVSSMEISNMLRLQHVSLGSSSSVSTIKIGKNINLIELDLSNKNIHRIEVSAENVKIYKLNLSGNESISDYSFLSNVYKLEELRLSGCALTDEIVKTIPLVETLKSLDVSYNETLSSFTFITPDKFPKLEYINLKSNAIKELVLQGFDQLAKIELEQLQITDNSYIDSVVLKDLPRFTTFTRGTEIKISNLTMDNIPNLKSLDLTVSGNKYEMTCVEIKNTGIEMFTLSQNVSIRNLTLENLFNLETLNLTNGVRTAIHFTNMSALKTLVLDNCNNLKDFDFLNEAYNLESLSLAQVGLTTEKFSVLVNPAYVKELNISYNKDINDYSFLDKFISLEVLDLSNNAMNDDRFATINKHDKLKEINLAYNTDITRIYFDGYQSLEKVLIESNNDETWSLKELRLENLSKFKNLVRVASTKIEEIYLTNLPELKSLNLGYSDCKKIVMVNVINLIALNLAGVSNVTIVTE